MRLILFLYAASDKTFDEFDGTVNRFKNQRRTRCRNQYGVSLREEYFFFSGTNLAGSVQTDKDDKGVQLGIITAHRLVEMIEAGAEIRCVEQFNRLVQTNLRRKCIRAG